MAEPGQTRTPEGPARKFRARGHFSTSLAIAEQGGPLERLVEVLGKLGAG